MCFDWLIDWTASVREAFTPHVFQVPYINAVWSPPVYCVQHIPPWLQIQFSTKATGNICHTFNMGSAYPLNLRHQPMDPTALLFLDLPAGSPHVLSRSVLRSLVASLVLSRLDYGNATLSGILLYLLRRFQSVTNSATRLVFSLSKYDSISLFLHQLHWLKAPERIQHKLAVLKFKCCTGQRHHTFPPVFGPWGSRSSLFSVIVITDRPSYTVVHCRRLSFLSRCCPCLERTTGSRHVCTGPCEFYAVVWRRTFSAVPFPTFCRACEVICVIIRHLN